MSDREYELPPLLSDSHSPGPSAPWLRGEEHDRVFSEVKQQLAEFLANALLARAQALLNVLTVNDTDLLLLEIRAQIAEAAVTGQITRASDLHERAVELLESREYSRRI